MPQVSVGFALAVTGAIVFTVFTFQGLFIRVGGLGVSEHVLSPE